MVETKCKSRGYVTMLDSPDTDRGIGGISEEQQKIFPHRNRQKEMASVSLGSFECLCQYG